MSALTILWPAFVLAILLVFIHAVFGIEIIKRGVIFTDLAIGQIAAVGMAISLAFLDGAYQTPLVFLFALGAGIIIAIATKKVAFIEAFIALLYALGISSIMLILAQSSEGVELFNKMSATDILFTMPKNVGKAALIYTFVALVMFFVYPKLTGLPKEILFFSMLAITVTSSVQNAGVLVVFALLIAPAYAAMVQKKVPKLLFAWTFGTLATIVALLFSYFLDLPTGYAIIFCVVLFSLIFVIVRSIDTAKKFDL
ncbi:metal ABC transporter permease [Nitratiruptor sp. SB155-2]|uniref:metal ABC transporter permease n=1 Tax=Nitratiruptor sp. (strain SB155-2) TaxID=387092 RepID=UPI0001586E30|nr:metal ABC transporter permease [Nitratiruptor sp. SB155-2]BAF69141.1 metal ion ABC transporter, permease [Nitratiruptor sp. SB155-2]